MQKIQWFTAGGGGGGSTSYWTADGDNIYNNNSGFVGVGTATPSAPLEVQGGSAGLTNILKITKAGGSQNYFSIFSNTSNTSRFDVSFLGVNNSDTNAAIQFIGGVNAAYDTGSNPIVTFQARRGATAGSGVSQRDLFNFANYGTSVMRIKANGNVGIGTTAPTERLHVSGGNLLVNGDATVGQQFFASNSTPARIYLGVGNSALTYLLSGRSALQIRVNTNSSSNSGTQSATFNPMRATGANFAAAGSELGSDNLSLYYAANPDDCFIGAIRRQSSGWFASNVHKLIGIGDNDYGNASAGTALWYTNNQVRSQGLLLSKTGNVGIGTLSPSERLAVVGRIALNDGNSNVAIGNDANTQTTGSFNTAIGVGALRGVGGATFNRNVGVGYEALGVLQDGNGQPFGNVALGYEAANQLVSGYGNIAIGERAQVGTTGDGSIAIGHAVVSTGVTIGFAANGTGGLAIGRVALATASNSHAVGSGAQATSSENQAFGSGCQATGAASVAYGYRTNATGARTITFGNQITASGDDSIGIGSITNITGLQAIGIGRLVAARDYTIAMGYETGRYTTGTSNILLGFNSGRGSSGASTFATCVGIGYKALTNLTTGNGNIGIGHEAGYGITSGAFNIGIGHQNHYALTTGSNNTAVGWQANRFIETTSGSTAIGYLANSRGVGSNNTAIGHRALQGEIGLTTGSNNAAIGASALTLITSGTSNNAFGVRALERLTSGTANTAIGLEAAQKITTGSLNVAVGHGALLNATTAANNVAIGYHALLNNTASSNTAVGYFAGRGNTAGTGLTAIGTLALAVSTANNNTALGFEAAAITTTGGENTAIGYGSLRLNTTGAYNTAVGSGVLRASIEDYNTAVGYQTLYQATGAGNTSVGYRAGYANTTGDNNVFLGKEAGYNETGSNRLYIENSNSASPLIYGEFDNDLVRINGSFEATSGYGFGGQAASAIQTGYAPTNVTTTRAFDADTVALDVLADVVGTLIEDLKAKGLISA